MTTLGDLTRDGVLEFSDGYRTRRDQHSYDGYRILRAGDVSAARIHPRGPDFVDLRYAEVIGEKTARRGDVVLTTKGTVGRTALVADINELIVYSPQVCYFRSRSTALDHRFFFHWLSSPEFMNQAGYLKNATDMAPYISLTDLASTRIDLPPVSTQRAIADVLGALDDKIAANDHAGDAARVLMIALASQLASQPPATLKAVAVNRKKQISPAAMGTVAHFSLPAFDNGEGPAEDSGATIKSNKLTVEAPAVLLSRLNPRIPRVWDLPRLPEIPAVASTEFLVLEPRGASTSALWAVLSQPSVTGRLQELARGTSGSHQRVRPDDALGIRVPDPRLLEPATAGLIEDLGTRRWLARVESRRLAVLRDALLPHLMSGRITVREAEEAVGEVL